MDVKPPSQWNLFCTILRLRGETIYEETPAETNEDFIILSGLRPGEIYEVKVVAVDGEFNTESHSEDVETFSVGKFSETIILLIFCTMCFEKDFLYFRGSHYSA